MTVYDVPAGRAVCKAVEGRKAIHGYLIHDGSKRLDPEFGGDKPVEFKPKRPTAKQLRALLAGVLDGDPEAAREAREVLAA